MLGQKIDEWAKRLPDLLEKNKMKSDNKNKAKNKNSKTVMKKSMKKSNKETVKSRNYHKEYKNLFRGLAMEMYRICLDDDMPGSAWTHFHSNKTLFTKREIDEAHERAWKKKYPKGWSGGCICDSDYSDSEEYSSDYSEEEEE